MRPHHISVILLGASIVGCGQAQTETEPRAFLSCHVPDRAVTALHFIGPSLRANLDDHVASVKVGMEIQNPWRSVQFDWETRLGELLDFDFLARTGLLPDQVPRDIEEGLELLERIESASVPLSNVANTELKACEAARTASPTPSHCRFVTGWFEHFSRQCKRLGERIERLEGHRRRKVTEQGAFQLAFSARFIDSSVSMAGGNPIVSALLKPRPTPEGLRDVAEFAEDYDLTTLRLASLAVKMMAASRPLGCEVPIELDCPF
jgi:hypothetical protein